MRGKPPAMLLQACLVQCLFSSQQYLILKQTLGSPEARLDHGGQTCESAGSQPGPPLEDQYYRDRTTGEQDHADDSCWRLRSQPHKSPERLATTDETTAGAKYRDPNRRRAGSQLPTPSDKQAIENRLTKEPHPGEQTFRGTCLQLTKPEDQTPTDLKHKGHCSGKARTQLPTLRVDPSIEDKSPRRLDHKEPNCQRARPRELGLSEDRVIWGGTWAEHGTLDPWKTKPPRAQPPVIKAPEVKLPMSLALKDEKTRGMDHGDQGHLRNCLLQGR